MLLGAAAGFGFSCTTIVWCFLFVLTVADFCSLRTCPLRTGTGHHDSSLMINKSRIRVAGQLVSFGDKQVHTVVFGAAKENSQSQRKIPS